MGLGLIGGIVESHVENTVRHAAEDAVNEAVDKKAKEGDTTAAEVAKTAQRVRHGVREGKAAINLIENASSGTGGFLSSLWAAINRWLR